MVEEMLGARGILISHKTVGQGARKFGAAFANQIRQRLPQSLSARFVRRLRTLRVAAA